MKKLSKLFILLTCLLPMLLLESCGFSDMDNVFGKAQKITSVIQNNCDCDEVSLVGYSIENFTTTATYKLVGCEFKNIDQEAVRVKGVLSDSIPEFCEIDHFNLIFVNKGNEKVKSYSKCKEEQ